MTMHTLTRLARLARLAAAASLAAAFSMPAAAQNLATFTGLYVFGDSLSDSGNNNLQFGGLTGPAPTSGTFVPTLPYAASPPGAYRPTYSNGPTWVTPFAAGLGLSAFSTPSLIGGGNYAYGGARMFTDGVAPAPLPPNFPASVQTQLNSYLGSATVSPTALYVIAGGGNDVREVGTAVAGGAPLVPTTIAAATAYATSAAQMVSSLRAAGATQIVVWNVPNVGLTPAAGSGVGPAAAAGSFISGAFNSALAQALAGSGATIFDVYGLIGNVVANPASYGMTNVTEACGFAGNGCNPATALFWDGIHPTAYAHSIVANAMLAAVPEPATWLLMATGVMTLLVARRRQA